MDSIMRNNTWVLADLPPGCKPLGYKWIFKRKLKVDGTVENFKARLVIQGFKQKSGIDYFETYAPVARISTIILLIAMTSIHNLIIHQMDVRIAFLNNELEEEVYMNQPQGFVMPGNENKVDLTTEFLLSKFSMKDMGEADVIIGIRIKHEISTPIDTSKKLMPNNGQVVSQLEYSRVIGCLMYAMTCTRPDITFFMGKLSRYTSNQLDTSKKQTRITGKEANLLVERDDILCQLKTNLLAVKNYMEMKANRKQREIEFNPGAGEEVVAELLEEEHEGHPLEQPLAICDSRLVLRNGLPTHQVLVQWVRSSPEEATWEWLSEFQATYLSYHLEEKVIIEEERNVMPTIIEEEGVTASAVDDEGRPKRVVSILL
nr:zinc finger, CCHC-type [Tanacetum cinerariifolium]